jgi:N-dimethylarginine dimethylaminohydrolase
MTIPIGVQSMVEPLHHVLVQRPTAEFGAAQDDPRHGFLHEVDLEVGRKEHDLFCELLSDLGVTVHQLDGASPSPDLVYTFDPSFITSGGAILLRSGKASRQGEQDVHSGWYRANGIPIIGWIDAPGTVDGGDVMWLRHDLIAVGRSLRTNQAGIDQLAGVVADAAVLVFDVPVGGGEDECLHLMSAISMLADDLAVVQASLLPSGLYSMLRDLGVTLIDIGPTETTNLAANVLTVRPGVAVVIDGSPITRAALERHGVEVHPFAGGEIAINGSGGPTCLTRPLHRA